MSFGRNAMGNGFQPGALGTIASSLFTDARRPYEEASDVLNSYLPEVQQYQQPFYQAGVGAIPGFQQWLSQMKDPSAFINNLMNQYQESPNARYLQQQSQRAGTNAASASGLIGSTPYAQQLQQNSANISSQDMNNWLQRVLGINTQYGAGQSGLMSQGAGAANSLADLLARMASSQAQLGFGKEYAEQQQTGNLIRGLFGLFGV